MRIGEKTRFARILAKRFKKRSFVLRIDSREPIRANLRNVGVRIACPLSECLKMAEIFGQSSSTFSQNEAIFIHFQPKFNHFQPENG